MLRTRAIPCLLLKNASLVKTVRFQDPSYVGDPINAIRIYNEKEVNELIFLDITATIDNKPPQWDIIAEIASECFMPLTYGGGVKTVEDAKRIFSLGIEKIALNSEAVAKPALIRAMADNFGSQSVVVSIDARRTRSGGYEVFTHGGRKPTGLDPVTFAVRMEQAGAGEILLTAIDRDGTMQGYDLALTKSVTDAVGLPVIACGGAGKVGDFRAVVKEGGASAVAAGSMVVYFGLHRAVLINFPEKRLLEAAFQ